VPRREAEFGIYGNVQGMLREWARWRWTNHGADIGYPHEAPFRRLMLVEGESNLPAVIMHDDTALGVDRAVAQLKLRSQPVKGDYRWIALMDSYLGGYLDRQIAFRQKTSRSTIRNARVAAENWIEAYVLTAPELTRKSVNGTGAKTAP
jgi:hypothetical protein